MAMSWDQLLSLVGAAIILSGYALQSFGPENAYKKTYLLLNLVGAGALTITAIVNDQFGFILLEGTWALISAYSLARVVLKKQS